MRVDIGKNSYSSCNNRFRLVVRLQGEMPRDPRLGPSLKLPAEEKRRPESQCWVILSHSEQFYTDVLNTEGIFFVVSARHTLAFIHIGASQLQPDHKTPQDKYHGRLARSSDRHSHFFRNHNFCLCTARYILVIF